MTRRFQRGRLLAIAFGCLLWTGIPVLANTSSFIDLNLDLGYASNPRLREDGKSSAFGRLSAFALQSWRTERASSSVTIFLGNTTYAKDLGSTQVFDLKANTIQSVNPTLTLTGNLGFSGDIAGQLSNRFRYSPTNPVAPDPSDPFPPSVENPDLFNLSGRQYRVSGNVGASIEKSPRSTVSLSAGAQRLIFANSGSGANYSTYLATVGYSEKLTERTSLGGSLYLQRQDYKGNNDASVINPVVTLQSQVRESVSATASVGLLAIVQEDSGKKDHSLSPSFSGSLCRSTDLARYCGRISRDARSPLGTQSAEGGQRTTISTSGSLEYFRRVGRDQTLQGSVSGVRYSTPGQLDEQKARRTYFTGLLGYDRKIGNRFSTGVSIGARRLYQSGPDPDTDLNGSIYLHYRIGDLL